MKAIYLSPLLFLSGFLSALYSRGFVEKKINMNLNVPVIILLSAGLVLLFLKK